MRGAATYFKSISHGTIENGTGSPFDEQTQEVELRKVKKVKNDTEELAGVKIEDNNEDGDKKLVVVLSQRMNHSV